MEPLSQKLLHEREDVVREAIAKCKKHMEDVHGHPPGTEDYVGDVLDALDVWWLGVKGVDSTPWIKPPPPPPDPVGVSKVFEALLKKPDVLYGIIKEMWEHELYIAGPWEKDLVSYSRYYADAKVAAEVVSNGKTSMWDWRVSVPNESHDTAKGHADSVEKAAMEADMALSTFRVYVASPKLPKEGS